MEEDRDTVVMSEGSGHLSNWDFQIRRWSVVLSDGFTFVVTQVTDDEIRLQETFRNIGLARWMKEGHQQWVLYFGVSI